MAVTWTQEGRRLTVSLSGELDHHAARNMMLELDRGIESRFPVVLIMDFSGISFMDSSGIAVVLRTFRRMKESGGTLRLVNVRPQAAKVLEAAGVHRLIPMNPQTAQAAKEDT